MTRRTVLAALVGLPMLHCTPAPVAAATRMRDAAERTGQAVFFHDLRAQPVPVLRVEGRR